MLSSVFGEEIRKSKPAPTPLAQLIIDLRKLGTGSTPSVNGPAQLRDHLARHIASLTAIHERASALADPPQAEPEEKPKSKRKAAKTKDRQETGGTNRSDSD